MFIQVIKGQVSDPDEARAAMDRWSKQEAPAAVGFLGSTAGITDDGTFIALARFESEDAARQNSDRPEQNQWWTETSKLFSGDVTFHDCREVVEFGRGGSDDAGFVQVMEGRLRDVDAARDLYTRQADAMGEDFCPDVIGGVVALHGDGGYTTAVYFTSEDAAREGERKEAPADVQALFEEERALHEGDITFYDLRNPILISPAR